MNTETAGFALPTGRVAREMDDYHGILLDAALYGNVYQIARVPGHEPRIVVTSEPNGSPPVVSVEKSAEQQARDLLEQYGVEDAQSMTAGDLVELANLIADANAYRRGPV